MPVASVSLVAESRARRNLWVLVGAQVLLGSQLPVTFILGGLAGQMLAPSRCLATLPITLIITGSMLSAPFLWPDAAAGPHDGLCSWRHRRRYGFGNLRPCAGSGLVRALSGRLVRLWPLHVRAGILRFAATDGVAAEFRPRAISFVMGAGLASA